MFDMGFAEMIIIALLALVVMGPERLPHAIRSTLKWVNYLRQTASTLRDTVEQELNLDEIKKELQTEEIERQVESFKQQAAKTSKDFKKVSLKNKNDISRLMDDGQVSDLKVVHEKGEAA